MKKGTSASPATALDSRVYRCREADKQHTFKDARTDLGIALRTLEEVDDLREFLLRLIHARHIGEGDPRLLIGHVHLGLALGEAQRPLSTTAHRAAGKELKHQDENQGRHHPAEDGGEDIRLLGGELPRIQRP